MVEVGTKVEMSGVKDAVVVGLVRKATRTKPAWWLIEYTVDDQLERENPTGKRYTQARCENEFTIQLMRYRGYVIECDGRGPEVARWSWRHEDYDGPEDRRCGYSPTHLKSLADIDEQIEAA